MQIARTKMMSSQITMLQIVQTLLLVLLASTNYYSCVNAVFLSIDCGGSDSYTDTNSIKWVVDDDYVRNGESRLVQFSSSLPDVVNTLRAFPTLKRNCYTINSLDGGQRILVRASFYYGNYDGKDSPPTFELQFDGNYWTKVNMSKHLSFEVVNYEVIYTVNKITNSTSICLTQTLPDQIPFITALELRSLGSQMYAHVASHYALFRQTRIALGAYQTVRYPEDAYDRKWAPGYGFGLEEVTSEAVSIDVGTAEDSPPETVLKNATTANNTLEYIRLITNLPDFDVPVYITTYFSEVTQTKQQRRSFQLCVDDKPYSKPIIPPFGSVAEVYITNITASYNTSFTLVATSDSTLPPLINAFEIYSISDASTPGTHFKDVEGLAALQMQFQVLLAWTGDPCLPSPFTWEWVECSTHAIPRVTALNLSSFGLFGSLPDFSSMDALVTIDLHNNSLDGPIPDFLGSFPMLKLLDLSDNRFNGTVPTSLITNKKLEFQVSGNCLSGMSCPPPPPPPPDTRRPKPTAPPLISNSENKESPPPPPETRRPKPTAPPLISNSENKKSPPDENNFDDNVPFYTISTSASAANINISNQLFLFIYICLVAFF